MSRENIRTNLFLYKLAAAETSEESAVVLQQEGDIGLYNRANRCLYHFMENSHSTILGIMLNSFVYPKPTFFLVLAYVIGRVAYTMGYTYVGFGAHMPGFAILRVSDLTMMAMFCMIAIKSG